MTDSSEIESHQHVMPVSTSEQPSADPSLWNALGNAGHLKTENGFGLG